MFQFILNGIFSKIQSIQFFENIIWAHLIDSWIAHSSTQYLLFLLWILFRKTINRTEFSHDSWDSDAVWCLSRSLLYVNFYFARSIFFFTSTLLSVFFLFAAYSSHLIWLDHIKMWLRQIKCDKHQCKQNL